ncbi:hypothetical protein RH915_08945 [Serpentinicella sp. ANB-PHB4]|uniref:hypothetical protein n=1 Tax=Serpentinicella sp. ANB-PHB4 TaxID=3074076 RepID=UPI0028607510|nr:hypothetical protein [Serpentinicella sp. ANB-PHB4]MDR5659620.1 hypothetical protein [Serpentinicella sp. ANB-PHB4]
MMQILKDIYYTNTDVLRKTWKGLIKSWPIVFTGLFYTFATILLYMLVPYFGILGGLLMIIGTSALISNYLYLLSNIVKRGKFDYQDFKEGFTAYLRKVWGLLFFAYVASLGMSYFIIPILRGLLPPVILNLILTLGIFILFNVIPEVIYQKYYNPWETIVYAVEFIKDNVIEWFIPNLILIGVLYFLTGELLTGIFNYYISVTGLLSSPYNIVIYIVGQIWFSLLMIYRGYLFNTLSTSSRRKRMFMRKF